MRARTAARWWLGAALLLAVPLAGCGGGQAQRPSVSVGMFDNFYARDVTRVPAGTPVVFENKGYAPHNAVATGGAFRTPQTIDAEQSATVVANLAPGVYRYYCTFHATPDATDGMVATLVVGDVPYDPGKQARGTGVAPVAEASGATRRVPEDYRTIQAAVDAAKPGDLVLIGPGVYREEVKVRTPSLVLRGRDRNTVVVDGEFRRANAVSVTADGVAVENLTVRNAKVNGVFWTGVTGYRASYVTAVNNEVYGETFSNQVRRPGRSPLRSGVSLSVKCSHPAKCDNAHCSLGTVSAAPPMVWQVGIDGLAGTWRGVGRGLLRLVDARRVEAGPQAVRSDRQGQLFERNRQPLIRRLLDRELVVSAS